jgi:hypothetical protein
MTTMPITQEPRNRTKRRTSSRPIVTEGERWEAIERLVTLLEANAPESPRLSLPRQGDPTNQLNQMARLRQARAAYALETNGDFVRVGHGAWIRRALVAA